MPYFLDYTNQYVSDWDNFSILPYHFDDLFVKPWDEVAEVCKYRKFVDKKSKAASRKRLSTIIYENAQYLNGSKKTDKNLLTVRFLEQWIMACDYLKAHHASDSEGLEILGQTYSKVYGPFQFLTPDIQNVVYLAGLQLGHSNALEMQADDKKRRERKRKALEELRSQWLAVTEKAAYLLKTADDIKLLQPAVTKALASIEEEIEFLANR